MKLLALLIFVSTGLLGGARLAEAQAPPILKATHEEILEAVRTRAAPLTVVNVWATWCAPCIHEFPAFVRLSEEYAEAGVAVVFVSADFEDELPAVEAFLKAQGWTDPSFLHVGKDHEFVTAMHAGWSGALPATFLYGPDGAVRAYWEGKIDDYEDLERRVRAHLGG